jgi:hypothetical protein
MKSILIILVLTAALGAVGFFGTAELARRVQNARLSEERTVSDTGFQLFRGGLIERQRYAMIGGAVGAGIGFLGGVLIAWRSDRKNRRKASNSQAA